MTFTNDTSFEAMATPFTSPDGTEVVLVLVKATFVRAPNGSLVLAEEMEPIRVADEATDPDAEDSSVEYPGDLCTQKAGTDVVIVGDALAPRPSAFVDVAARIAERVVRLRVHGERVYYRSSAGLAVSDGAPFERKPIVYERAYGGTSADKLHVELRNPVGKGIEPRVGDAAPQIEDPARPIRLASETPEPVGFGAIAPHWSPRRELAGTFDEAWNRDRIPLMPRDFDVRHNNVAHPRLQFGLLELGTPIAIAGMTLGEPWAITLPAMRVRIFGHYRDGRICDVAPRVDTILVEPEEDSIELTMRYAFPMRRGSKGLCNVVVTDDD